MFWEGLGNIPIKFLKEFLKAPSNIQESKPLIYDFALPLYEHSLLFV